VVVPARVVEIRSHPVAQIDRLADVNDRAVVVSINVTTRLGGQGVEDALDMLGDFRHRTILS
jgi:hypothetical protein